MSTGLSGLMGAAMPGLAVGGAALTVLPWLRPNDDKARGVLAAVSLVLMSRYELWRWLQTLPPLGWTADWFVGFIFILTESLTVIGHGVTLLFMSRTSNRSPEVDANLAWLHQQGRTAPLVDVFICTYNEEATILEKTIVGAMAMDYPNFRVWVLDDGRRPWLEALCRRHGCCYLTRHDNAHAKAGNINNGINHVGQLSDPPDFVSILDADFVPLSNFLMRTVALFRDPRVGVVQTPQHFVNPDPIQANLAVPNIWPDEQRYFFDVIMPSKDAWGLAFCCGTSSVIRFEALRAIGGFPTDSVTEDYLVTLRMQQSQYRTVYLNEKLSIGLAPEGLAEYATQRSRWCLGLMQIIRGPLGPLRRGNGLPWLHRVSLIEAVLYWAMSFPFRLMCILVPICYWWLDIRAVKAELTDAVWYFLPYFVSQIAVTAWLGEGRLLPLMSDVGQLLVAPEIIRAVLAGLLQPKGQKFKVTPKGRLRDRLSIQWRLLTRFSLLLICTLTGVVVTFLTSGTRPVEEAGVLCLWWSWYNIGVLALACVVCVEQPRYRKDERRLSREPAMLFIGNRSYDFDVLDYSTGGLRLRGVAPAAIGTRVTVRLDRVQIEASIVRQGTGDFGLQVEGEQARRTMIRHFYSGHHGQGMLKVRAWQVIGAVMRRVFG
jgi:cellulose synthase (UDP-forming)